MAHFGGFFGFWLWTFCHLNLSLYSGLYPENAEFRLTVNSGTHLSCLALQDKCYCASFYFIYLVIWWLCSMLFEMARGRHRVLVPSDAVWPLAQVHLGFCPHVLAFSVIVLFGLEVLYKKLVTVLIWSYWKKSLKNVSPWKKHDTLSFFQQSSLLLKIIWRWRSCRTSVGCLLRRGSLLLLSPCLCCPPSRSALGICPWAPSDTAECLQQFFPT